MQFKAAKALAIIVIRTDLKLNLKEYENDIEIVELKNPEKRGNVKIRIEDDRFKFTVSLNRWVGDDIEMLKTIRHELCHVKQYIVALEHTGNVYDAKDAINDINMCCEYMDRPTEKQAFAYGYMQTNKYTVDLENYIVNEMKTMGW